MRYKAYAIEKDCIPRLLELHVQHVRTHSSSVRADRERRQGETGRFARRGDERAVDVDLGEVVVRIESCALVDEQLFVADIFPFDCQNVTDCEHPQTS